ncbi:MAG: prepilin peptidase [Nanoarchaeota archaeon]
MIIFISLLIGLCLGSFYNVCIHRYITGESIVLPASHCPKCNQNLSWWENIPVLSFVFLAGKCKSCSEPISIRYPIVELLSGFISVFLVVKFGIGIPYFLYMVMFGILIVVSFIDFEIFILPDTLILPGALFAFLSSFFLPLDWQNSLAGMLVGAGLFLFIQQAYKAIRKIDGMGTGDIKFMLMLGAMTGLQGLPVLVLVAAFSSLFASMFLLRGVKTSKAMQTPIPFGPFLAFGAIFYIFCEDMILKIIF